MATKNSKATNKKAEGEKSVSNNKKKLNVSKSTQEVIDKVMAPEKPKQKSKSETNKKPRATKTPSAPKKKEPQSNVIMDESSLKGKLDKTVTDYSDVEKDITRLVRWHIGHMDKVRGNEEGLDYHKLGEHHIVCRLGETGSFGGNTDKDHNTKGHYCPSGTKRGHWMMDGTKGNELLLNVWDLQNMTDEDYFNYVIHESIHAYSDLISETDKDRDCAKNGAHKKKFVELVEASGLLDPVPLSNYVKWTTTINDKGRKAMKKLKVTAPKIGKVAAPKKPKAKRVTLECENCELKVMVPYGKWEKGEVVLECTCGGTSTYGREMKATVSN